jgi:large subunit ribosomal protein L30
MPKKTASAQAVPANAELKVTQIKSKIGGNKAQRDSLRSLGLHRIGETVVKADRPEIRGMIQVVRHLVAVEEVRAGG